MFNSGKNIDYKLEQTLTKYQTQLQRAHLTSPSSIIYLKMMNLTLWKWFEY